MSDTDIVEIAVFALTSILTFLGAFSVIAKVTPWDDEKLAKELQEDPSRLKRWLSKLLWVIRVLGLAKRIK